MERNINKDMPLNWTEIASVLFFLSLKKCLISCENVQILEDFSSIMSDFLHRFPDIPFDIHCAGSTADGVNIPGHSDFDLMVIYNNYTCNEEIDRTTKFISDRINASPGYTLLWDIEKIAHRAFQYDDDDEITIRMKPFQKYVNEDSLVTVSSSSRNIKALPLKKLIINHNEIKELIQNALPIPFSFIGPALNGRLKFPSDLMQLVINIASSKISPEIDKTVSDNLKHAEFDFVLAMKFESKTIMQQWLERKRRHNWPSQELLQEISQMSGHIVPVGKKGSKFENYEFRICYTLAEIKLIRSLNEVQRSLFIILRIYAKDNKPDFPNISSYIIKNIILWLAETAHPSYFKYENMIPLIKSTLNVLKSCAEKGFFPNYMIPSRNLFDGKVEDKERKLLIERLSHVTKDGSDEIFMQFREPTSKLIAGVWSDKLSTFVKEIKETERKHRLASTYGAAVGNKLCDKIDTILYVYKLCGSSWIVLLPKLLLLPKLFCKMQNRSSKMLSRFSV